MEEEGEEPRLAAGKGKEMDFFLQPQKVIKPTLSKSDKWALVLKESFLLIQNK